MPIAWEELSEKQTTKLWYFLLFCMFFAIITSAQWTLSIIKDIPDKPTMIPYCVSDMDSSFENKSFYQNNSYNNGGDCDLVSQNPEFNFTKEYNDLLPIINELESLSSQVQKLEQQKNDILNKENNIRNEYNTSLNEKIANEDNPIYDKNHIKDTFLQTNSDLSNIDNEINTIKWNINTVISSNKLLIIKLSKKLDKANDGYYMSYLLYKTYIAILALLFSLVVFIVLYKIYVRQKSNNSPSTIIFSVATFSYGIILLEICVSFIWDVIPHKLMEIISNILSSFMPLLYIVQFLWPLLIIWFFWFLVFKIQKILYSKENILKRFISDKKCPGCGNHVDINKPYCPLCWYEIQIKCVKCNNHTLKWMPHCSSCGEKL